MPAFFMLDSFGKSELSCSVNKRRTDMLDREGRMVLILVNESRRMRESAERVDLVVRAMALRRGIRYEPPGGEEEG